MTAASYKSVRRGQTEEMKGDGEEMQPLMEENGNGFGSWGSMRRHFNLQVHSFLLAVQCSWNWLASRLVQFGLTASSLVSKRATRREHIAPSFKHKEASPHNAVVVPGLEISISEGTHLLSGGSRGDLCDTFKYSPGMYGFAVADVYGKAGPASHLLTILRISLRNREARRRAAKISHATAPTRAIATTGALVGTVSPRESVVDVIAKLNWQILAATTDAGFVSLFFAEYEAATGILRYSNAGQTPPLLLRHQTNGSKRIERLDVGGTVLGIFSQANYQEGCAKLVCGDVLVAFTDRTVKAYNARGEQFGEERLIGALENCADHSAAEIRKRLLLAIKSWVGDGVQDDDMALTVLKKGSSACFLATASHSKST